jgi:hypothetical protein
MAWIIGLSTLQLQEIKEYTLIEAVGGTVLVSDLNVIRGAPAAIGQRDDSIIA